VQWRSTSLSWSSQRLWYSSASSASWKRCPMASHLLVRKKQNKPLHTSLVTELTVDTESSRRAVGRSNSLARACPGEVFIFLGHRQIFGCLIQCIKCGHFYQQTGYVSPRDKELYSSLADFHGIFCWQNDLHILGNIFWAYLEFQSFWVHEWNFYLCFVSCLTFLFLCIPLREIYLKDI